MAAGQTFDFVSHLYHQTSVDWEIEELVGGVSNHTVRARRRKNPNSDENEGSGDYYDAMKPYGSVVLKQAPAYLAKAQHIPFSPYRQAIEAAALRLLHQSIGEHKFGLREVLIKNPNIIVPRILLEDTTHNVIIQSDLGNYPNLHEVLVSPDITLSLAVELGQTIGHFLANLHDVSHFSHNSPVVKTFMNIDAERVIQSNIGLATQCMKDAGIVDYEVLGKLALDHWNNRDKTAFGQGDIWFGTLLVNLYSRRPSDLDATVATVGICDWEFAGPNHPAADIAQLGLLFFFEFDLFDIILPSATLYRLISPFTVDVSVELFSRKGSSHGLLGIVI
ncbi:kinase-like domain-containing protein [Collybia nuda]|uniref:Kinase-like domain-containing protein n=1 Tax=Collybia nuda TaxID=64659 RepID=A0A9P5YFP8_9AGAR|nr:kinase-like domain-containing protein [Collybia nuda]